MSTRIEIRELSKAYRIGAKRASYGLLGDDLARLARRPLRSLRGERGTELWALSDVTFDVEEGDVVGIIGRNGSGKSTLLKILSRIVEPTRGEARITGRVTSLLEVGTGFHPQLSGRENIQLNGALLGMSRKEISTRFDEIVEFAGVEQFLDTPVRFYSSGMYVRLAFAIAAHLDPDILIVDEVLAVGDVGFQRKSLDKMRTVAGEGRTVLFVSHNADSVRSLCTRGVHLSAGRVITIDTVPEALASYQAELEAEAKATAAGSDIARKAYGAGGALITSLGTLDADNHPAAVFDPDEEIVLVLRAAVEPELLGQPTYVGFAIDSELGTSVFTNFSSWEDVQFVAHEKSLTIACRLPAPRLVSGQYFVSATLLSDRAMIDHVTRGASFSLRAGAEEMLWPQRVVTHGPVRMECVYEEIPEAASGLPADPELPLSPPAVP